MIDKYIFSRVSECRVTVLSASFHCQAYTSFHCHPNILLAAFASGINETNYVLLIPFFLMTPQSPQRQCFCQILVSTEAQAQSASHPHPLNSLSLSPLLQLPSVILQLTITLCSAWETAKSGILSSNTTFYRWVFNVFLTFLIARELEKVVLWGFLGRSKATCPQLQYGSDVFSAFAQQRPAAHQEDNSRLVTDFFNSKEPEGKSDNIQS